MTLAELLVVAAAIVSFKVWQLAITGYWKLPPGLYPATDILGRSHHECLARIRRRFGSTWTIPLALTAVCLLLAPWWRWDTVDPGHLLRPVVLVTSGIVTWRALTMDVDLATLTGHPRYRVLMGLAWVGVWWHPAFLIVLLHTGITWLRSYYHHQHLALRTLLMFLACVGAAPLLALSGPSPERADPFDITIPTLVLLLCVSASHYLVAGSKKLSLGPRWYSWMLDNRLHAIAISAYLWGWLRFLPEAVVIRGVRALRPFDRLFQIGAAVVELGALFVLFDPRLCLVLLGLFILFQALVATLTGIVFWQFMVVNAALAWAVWSAPPEVTAALFGLQPGLLAAAVMLAFPHRGLVWAPLRLGWWDTPFACRVHYEVKGQSGVWYGLYNDFMCPNERIFGQVYGAFLSDEPRVNWHIGETTRRDQFDALHAVGQDVSALDRVKTELGASRYDADLEAVHDEHLCAFLRHFNAGHRKRWVPAWLKAPGGQLFYWGERPRFCGQERIEELVIHYREHYFDGEQVRLVTDCRLKAFGPQELAAEDSQAS